MLPFRDEDQRISHFLSVCAAPLLSCAQPSDPPQRRVTAPTAISPTAISPAALSPSAASPSEARARTQKLAWAKTGPQAVHSADELAAMPTASTHLAALEAITESAPIGVAVVSPQGTVLNCNRRLAAVLGTSGAGLHAGGMHQHFEQPAQLSQLLARVAGGESVVREDMLLRTSSEKAVWGAVSMSPIRFENAPAALLWLFDITRLKRVESELSDLANYDALTGLYNRRALLERGVRALNKAREAAKHVCVLMIDIDHFKSVNDDFGHGVGDEALRHIAHMMGDELRGADVMGRMGGEEFAVVLPATRLSAALDVAERLRMQVASRPVSTDTGPLPLTVSVGVASVLGREADLTAALNRADQALYQAKADGRNCVRAGG